MLETLTGSCHNYYMQDSNDIHQCPFCELRFLYANEVRDHLRLDHPEHERLADSADRPELPR
jgi:hypothetical protein